MIVMAIIILLLIRIIFIIVIKIRRKSFFYNIPGYKHDIVSNSLLTDLPLGNEILSFGG